MVRHVKKFLAVGTAACAVAAFAALGRGTRFSMNESRLSQIESLAENQIDLGLLALELGKEFSPAIDVAAYDSKINALVAEARTRTMGLDTPEASVGALNDALLRPGQFALDRVSDTPEILKPAFLNLLLDKKLGNCVNLATLYLAVAQRLGYPVRAVAVPGHILVRYTLPDKRYWNIDPSRQGIAQTDAHYIDNCSVSAKGMAEAAYMRTLSHREFAGLLLYNNAKAHLNRGDFDTAIAYGESAVRLYPECAVCYAGLAEAYTNSAILAKGRDGLKDYATGLQHAQRAESLGHVRLRDTKGWRTRDGG
jgi:regulator of sirC expression with transglutaminase-like and TPR domain